jgi:carboxymethylenebutenolidase
MRYLILVLMFCFSFIAYGDDSSENLSTNPEANPATNPSENAPQRQGTELTLRSAYGTFLTGYVAGPDDATRGILILPDRWGMNDTIREWVDRFAARGYRALAVDLFDGRVSNTKKLAHEVVRQIDPEWVKVDAIAGLDYLKHRGRKLVTLGVGFGGWGSFYTSLAEPDAVAGTIVIYGRMDATEAQASKLKAPLLAIFALDDTQITAAMVEKYRLMIKKTLITYRSYSFPAAHGFMEPRNKSYNAEVTKEVWGQVDSFLADFIEN